MSALLTERQCLFSADNAERQLHELARSAQQFAHSQQQRWSQHFTGHRQYVIAECGISAALNFLFTAQAFQKFCAESRDCGASATIANSPARLHYYLLDSEPLAKPELARVLSAFPDLLPLTEQLLAHYPLPVRGWQRIHFPHITLVLIRDALTSALAQLRASNARMDAWHISESSAYVAGSSKAECEQWLFERLLTMAKTSRAGAGISLVPTALESLAVAAEVVSEDLQKAGYALRALRNDCAVNAQQKFISADLSERRPARISVPLTSNNVVVIGAGIAGCASARLLAERGFNVQVFEQQAHFGGVLHDHDFALAAPRWSVDHALSTQLQLAGLMLLREFLFRPEFAHTLSYAGFAELSDTPAQIPGLPLCEQINASDWPARIGCPLPAGAFWQQLGVALKPRAFCTQLLAHDNIRVHLNSAWPPNQHLANDYAAVIFCQGPASSDADLFGNAKIPWQLTPWQLIRGQCTHIQELAPLKNLRAPLRFGGYILPAESGQHFLGASFERVALYDSAGTHISADSNAAIWDALCAALPAVTENVTPQFGASHAGMRLSTRDHLPVCGRIEYAELAEKNTPPSSHANAQIWLNCAHGSHGLMTAMAAAEIIAAALSGDAQTLAPALIKAINPRRYLQS